MEIVNKVAESGIITIDLEEFVVKGERVLFDIKSWLFEEQILKEKDFRENLKNHDWEQYKGKLVAITCTVDAIVPTWAFMLIASKLEPFAKRISFGDIKKIDEDFFLEKLASLDASIYKDQRVVIKGCSGEEIPVSAYIQLTVFLRPLVKSIMYGEPCSTVPVYKKKE